MSSTSKGSSAQLYTEALKAKGGQSKLPLEENTAENPREKKNPGARQVLSPRPLPTGSLPVPQPWLTIEVDTDAAHSLLDTGPEQLGAAHW